MILAAHQLLSSLSKQSDSCLSCFEDTTSLMEWHNNPEISNWLCVQWTWAASSSTREAPPSRPKEQLILLSTSFVTKRSDWVVETVVYCLLRRWSTYMLIKGSFVIIIQVISSWISVYIQSAQMVSAHQWRVSVIQHRIRKVESTQCTLQKMQAYIL